jgi:Tfp pilus assembly protein PilV
VRLSSRFRFWLEDQRGLSLIEILGAVTIMSIISVTLMGYFITGLNKSEEQSRRIIAVNLARLKAAEIRQSIKPSDIYKDFLVTITDGKYDEHTILGTIDLSNQKVNGTTYHFKVSLEKRKDASLTASTSMKRNDELSKQMAILSSPDQYLIPMSITVYWDNDNSVASKSTAIDTYIVNRGET